VLESLSDQKLSAHFLTISISYFACQVSDVSEKKKKKKVGGGGGGKFFFYKQFLKNNKIKKKKN